MTDSDSVAATPDQILITLKPQISPPISGNELGAAMRLQPRSRGDVGLEN